MSISYLSNLIQKEKYIICLRTSICWDIGKDLKFSQVWSSFLTAYFTTVKVGDRYDPVSFQLDM